MDEYGVYQALPVKSDVLTDAQQWRLSLMKTI